MLPATLQATEVRSEWSAFFSLPDAQMLPDLISIPKTLCYSPSRHVASPVSPATKRDFAAIVSKVFSAHFAPK